MKGKLIVIEGTDCSGKETQAKLLKERLEKEGRKVYCISFPKYDSPTGKIVGGPYIGKESICESWFSDGPIQVDPLVASLYYAADRRYHIKKIQSHLDAGEIVIIDRYVESNMAHQGSKYEQKVERLKLYKKLETLEFEILELPRPDLVFFLHLPYEYGETLRQKRKNLDSCETDANHLKRTEQVYLELTKLYHFILIPCVKEKKVKSIEEIHDNIYEYIKGE